MEEEQHWEWTEGEINLTNHVLTFEHPITAHTFFTFFKPKLDMLGLKLIESQMSYEGIVAFIYIATNGEYILVHYPFSKAKTQLDNVGWNPNDVFNANEIFNLHCI